jgi:hypothetical protein
MNRPAGRPSSAWWCAQCEVVIQMRDDSGSGFRESGGRPGTAGPGPGNSRGDGPPPPPRRSRRGTAVATHLAAALLAAGAAVGDSAPKYPLYSVLGCGRTGQAGTDNPVLEPGEHRLSRVGLEVLPGHHQGCNRRDPYSGHRYQGGQGIVLPVDGADLAGGQDRAADQGVVDYLDTAADLRVIPGPGVVEGGGEERRVVAGRVFTGLFADCHSRMFAQAGWRVNGSPDVGVAGAAVAAVDGSGGVLACG